MGFSLLLLFYMIWHVTTVHWTTGYTSKKIKDDKAHFHYLGLCFFFFLNTKIVLSITHSRLSLDASFGFDESAPQKTTTIQSNVNVLAPRGSWSKQVHLHYSLLLLRCNGGEGCNRGEGNSTQGAHWLSWNIQVANPQFSWVQGDSRSNKRMKTSVEVLRQTNLHLTVIAWGIYTQNKNKNTQINRKIKSFLAHRSTLWMHFESPDYIL